ncbi:acetyl-CoA carboxylase biotin carboxyl carrier protein [Fulvivirga sp. 29W222]|uniref:Biotin carboxyl carrier protein of acetyl-CoA carboxylase n=1 Tax=Fulvivirga marina TaxID=2494733 RepID=A0A937KFU4_9BACT|nr:acetyl-CoA carboxylase biotin carboxyl carrier protein [Fulvivirga marina]MBL6448655.1 acetyl-CoA carboxylase biotin carboxyl carrier protein [Fulvivirga marina]
MKTKEIRDLIDFISQTGLNEVNIETEELKLSVKRDAEVQTRIVEASAPAIAPQPVPVAAPVQQAAPAPSAGGSEAPKAENTSNYVEVKSPMIGTFYRSPNPDSPAFVAVGDKIEKGQPVCIIEAMKLFNEIESEVSGTIVKVMVDNASPVEYDQVLFLVDPS